MQEVVGGKKQHLPIFVGSTFTDMQEHRKAIQAALGQLETIVRGMEHFGSKPGSPAEECLSVVRSCKVYVGVFGMRYGSIPNNHDKSMAHLEYDEAQRLAERDDAVADGDERGRGVGHEPGRGADHQRRFHANGLDRGRHGLGGKQRF